MTNLIAAAVEPQKQDAIDRAEQYALKRIEEVAADLAATNYDLNVCAPYLSHDRHNTRYYQFSALTKWRQATYSVKEPHYADMSDVKCAHYVKQAKENAAAQYDAFVQKLCAKIGEVTEANLEGNHVWSHSFLTVTTIAGDQQIWKTQMILNISKLGLVFNQWPTRKVKNKL